jgi:hypothetical protein
VALEGCTQLQALSLDPVSGATAAGLIGLCDACDSLESLMLAHCPRVSEQVILEVFCLRAFDAACDTACLALSCETTCLPCHVICHVSLVIVGCLPCQSL